MQQEIIEGYRLSPQQKYLWSLQQIGSYSPFRAYCAMLNAGNLDLKILEVALKKVLNRHEILRTNFRCLPGMTIPLQVLSDSSTPAIHYHYLNDLNIAEQEIKIQEILHEVSQLPFDFDQGSLLYVSLIVLSPHQHQHILVLSLPAMIADTATVRNLGQEISRAYTACLNGEELSDEPMQYVDFAEWQNELMAAEDTEIGREYWHKWDISAALALKLPFQKIHKSKFQPQVITLKIEPDLIVKIAEIVEKYQISSSMFLLSCWLILLWRLTNQQNIIVGHAFTGRKYEYLEQALGLFAKYVPLHCHLDQQSKFSEIINQIQVNIAEVSRWQEYFNWEQVTGETENKLAFFPVSFDFEERPKNYGEQGLPFSVLQQYVCFDQFNIKLCGIRQNDALTAEFHYNANLFNVETIEDLANQFQTLLKSIINNPEAVLAELQILNDHARQQLLFEFNQTQTNYPQSQCIHHLFEQQVNSTPDQIAVVFADQKLTYRELNIRANQLAHHLQQLGVGTETLVGLFVERSLELIVGLLGILKAGGAYLPLDPTLPTQGLALRLQDAKVGVLLSQHHLVARLPEHLVQVVCLDIDWGVIATKSQQNPNSKVTVANLAYVLFTSGSTGKPKGVAVEHQQLLNYCNAISEKLGLAACTNFATVSTIAADLGNTAIFPSLCTGGCLHIISSERAANPEALADYFRSHPIDCLKIVPSHLAALLICSHPEQILPRERLILGGEACSWSLIEQIQELKSECLIFNHYGPTETTVGTLIYPIQQGQTHYSQTVPIGRAIANTQVYLLDSYLQPVPIGVSGEVYIGGAGVARGYFNRPDLTQEKFIANPFVQTGQRLYKTGDLARYLPDGNIEFLGRIDHQVKIHGFRIELGEIEAALRQHPAVRETVVLAYEAQPGKKRLIAYVVSEKQSAPTTTTELRQFLLELLPDYMLPSVFLQLKALPLTPNGKVDRQSLPAPDLIRSEWEGNFVAPRTNIEAKLAKLWSEILGLEQVGIYDNFFELGGDSILSMQIIAKANQVGLWLTPKQLFEHQTIASLATVAQTNRVISASQGPVTGQVPLTPIQHWFFEQNLPDSHYWNQSILLEVRQSIDPALLEQAVQKLLEHHDALRLRFVHQASNWQQVSASPDKVISLTKVDLSSLSPDEQESVISATAAKLQTSLNLFLGPLVQIALFDLGTNKPDRLLIIIHHLAVDGVSWRILLSDLQTAYQQISQGEAIQLPPKTTSFQHWAERLGEYAHSAALVQEGEYWRNQHHRQIPPIPIDFVAGNNTIAQARTITAALSREETQALLQDVSAAYQTQINDVLLTALVQAFEQWTGQSGVLVDLEGHGREEIFDDVDLSRTVGWFTTIFPILLDLGEAFDSGEALKKVKEQLRSVPHRGIGYGVLRYLSSKRAKFQHQPQAEVRFNYLGQSDQVFQESSLFAPALESTGLERSHRGSRRYLLDISGIVTGGQLQLNWTYSEAVHDSQTIEGLAKRFIKALRQLITHCQSLKTRQTEMPSSTDKITVAILNAEAVLSSSIRPEQAFEQITAPAHILLTGATGFVGAFLLHELLQQTTADIYCLVRASNLESGRERLQRHLESYLLWNESLSNRIIPVIGDLSQPLLGLSDEQFQVMANQLDVIYHNGAAINLVYPYSTLKAANVLGTQEVLRLASQFKVKPVHYISTLSVLSSKDHSEVKGIRELHSFNHRQVPSGGYAQTKWVAEKLAATAYDRGIPVCIYRLGRVSGHSQIGVCNPNDRLYRMLKGFIQLGYAPDVETTVDMMPVDYVSRAIAHLSRQEKSLGKIFHLSNPHPISSSQLFDWIRQFGYPLEPISHNQWSAELLKASERSLDNPLYPLIPFFAGMEAKDVHQQKSSEPTSNSVAFEFNCHHTKAGLADTSIICPPVDSQLLTTYFSYLIHSGVLNSPQISKMHC